MNSLLLKSLALAVVAGSLCFAQVASAAAVSFYGFQVDTPGWRSTDIPKIITTPGGNVLAPTNYYGSDGYTALSSFVMPSYISAQSTGSSTYVPSAYQPIDNPAVPVAPVVADMVSSLLYQIPGAGVETVNPLFSFTVGSSAPASFLMGIAFGNLPLDQSPYLGASFRVAIGASTTEQIPLIENNGLIDWLFFKVDDAANFDVINIYGIGGPDPYGFADLAAVSFDTVPEPGTYALLGLAGFGLALHRLRRRRRTS